MTDLLVIMAAPIVMSVVLVGVHAQLGLHVVRRGVIFVDIALAQAAALGTAIAVALGLEGGSWQTSLVGLAAALLTAGIISRTRNLSRKVPQEAFIGITFVVAAAAVILVLARLPHGGEEIEDLLVGSILWVTWADVLRMAILYAILGTVFFRFRRQFWMLSDDPEAAYAQGMRVGFWDFFFFAILGIVVTASVQVAGVFMVFSLLVVPAVMSLLLSERNNLALAWGLGTTLCVLGALLSYWLDLPTGATIVVLFGLALPLATWGRRRAA